MDFYSRSRKSVFLRNCYFWGAHIISSSGRRRVIILVLFVIYIFVVLWITVLNRAIGFRIPRFDIFWSLKSWISGDTSQARLILSNIAMFVPFGFMLSAAIPIKSRVKRGAIVISSALVFSLVIEALQHLLMRGQFDIDDLVTNTVGAAVGFAVYVVLRKIISDRHVFNTVASAIAVLIVIVSIAVLVTGYGGQGIEADATAGAFCFQIEEAKLDGQTLSISGFTFRYVHPDGEPTITLRSVDSGAEIKLDVNYGLATPEVNEYFLCDYNYGNTGFTATGTVNPDTEYEIMVRWPWMVSTSSDVFITGDDVHYKNTKAFVAPDVSDAPDLKEIVENGAIRVYRPDYHCWIYQYNGAIYWIADTGFNFESDNTTLIQYQLYTTQFSNLPERRIANGHRWDNISGNFESHELKGNFGQYRVMKEDLPTAYSLVLILTGYYANGSWVWHNYFRPIYGFGN